MSAVASAPDTIEQDYHAYGAIAALFRLATSGQMPSEVVVKGPAGTGKSRGVLEFLNWVATEYPGCRLLMVRKTRRSLTESGMVTFERQVLHPAQGVTLQISLQRYAYPNGSILAVAGLDKPGKVMSSEWDIIYVQEANEISENDYEACTTRLRNGVVPFQSIIADRNPDAPHHWLRLREVAGRALLLHSYHQDNPTLYDRAGQTWTARGAAYLAKLGELTGVRRKRLLLGIDAAAEGTVYEDAWNAAAHVVARKRYSKRPDKGLHGDCGIDPMWSRYIGVDWGYKNPAVLKWYARMPDGELLVYREIYATHQLVEDLAREALSLMGWRLSESGALVMTRADADPLPREIIADHDAEDRATFERHFGMSVFPADKGRNSISDGIQAVTKRLQDRRLLYLEDSLVQRDPLLSDAKRPCSSVEEFESYVWDQRAGRAPREVPMDDNNHGMDVDRYVVTYHDREPQTGNSIEFRALGF